MAQKKTEEEAKTASSEDTKKQVSKNKKYKLANPKTSYSENNFTLAGDQEKELPEDPSPQLLDRIRNGFIVEA